MKYLATGIVLLSVSFGAMAQQKNTTFKVKPTHERAPQKAPLVSGKEKNTATANNAKDLQTVEHSTAKTPAATGQKKAPPFKPVKDKSTGPMNVASNSKSASMSRASANPLGGRLKQKGVYQPK